MGNSSYRIEPIKYTHIIEHGSLEDGIMISEGHMHGWRTNQEDAAIFIKQIKELRGCHLLGLFDGHGGAHVALYAARNLERVFREQLRVFRTDYEPTDGGELAAIAENKESTDVEEITVPLYKQAKQKLQEKKDDYNLYMNKIMQNEENKNKFGEVDTSTMAKFATLSADPEENQGAKKRELSPYQIQQALYGIYDMADDDNNCVEAFFKMLKWEKENEDYIEANGKSDDGFNISPVAESTELPTDEPKKAPDNIKILFENTFEKLDEEIKNEFYKEDKTTSHSHVLSALRVRRLLDDEDEKLASQVEELREAVSDAQHKIDIDNNEQLNKYLADINIALKRAEDAVVSTAEDAAEDKMGFYILDEKYSKQIEKAAAAAAAVKEAARIAPRAAPFHVEVNLEEEAAEAAAKAEAVRREQVLIDHVEDVVQKWLIKAKEYKKRMTEYNQKRNSLLEHRRHARVVGGHGAAATIVLFTPKWVIMANAGDCRTIYLDKKEKKVYGTKDHKPDDAVETLRIENAGGWVTGGRVLGINSVSRGLGDWSFKSNKDKTLSQQMMTSLPDVTIEERSNIDFVATGCDGIWDKLNNSVVSEHLSNNIRVITKQLEEKPQDYVAAAEEDVDESYFKEKMSETVKNISGLALTSGSQDNISFILTSFNTNARVVYAEGAAENLGEHADEWMRWDKEQIKAWVEVENITSDKKYLKTFMENLAPRIFLMNVVDDDKEKYNNWLKKNLLTVTPDVIKGEVKRLGLSPVHYRRLSASLINLKDGKYNAGTPGRDKLNSQLPPTSQFSLSDSAAAASAEAASGGKKSRRKRTKKRRTKGGGKKSRKLRKRTTLKGGKRKRRRTRRRR